MWTAAAEGRFLAGAFTAPSRHPVVLVGRILLVVALVAPGLGPVFSTFHTANGVSRLPVVLGIAVVALLLTRRMTSRRR